MTIPYLAGIGLPGHGFYGYGEARAFYCSGAGCTGTLEQLIYESDRAYTEIGSARFRVQGGAVRLTVKGFIAWGVRHKVRKKCYCGTLFNVAPPPPLPPNDRASGRQEIAVPQQVPSASHGSEVPVD